MGGSAKPAGDQDKDSRARWRTPSWGQDSVLVHGGLALIWLQWAPGGSQGRPWLPCSVSVSVAHIWIPSIFSRLEPWPWGSARSLQRCVCQRPCLLCKKTKGRPACWFGFIRRWLWTGGQCPVASIPLRGALEPWGLGWPGLAGFSLLPALPWSPCSPAHGGSSLGFWCPVLGNKSLCLMGKLRLLFFFFHNSTLSASLVVQTVKNLPALRETWVWSLNWEDPLEKEMTTHSSILAWEIPWTEEPGGIHSMGSQSQTRLNQTHSSAF